MEPVLHSTADYHRRTMKSLGWELTVCNMLEPLDSPCRSILKTKTSYGHLLCDFLAGNLPMEEVHNVIEVGGGYGFLMRDFLDRNPGRAVTMLDISPVLLQRQLETLRGGQIAWRQEDFLSSGLQTLAGFDLAVLNEIFGDFPVVTNLGGDDLSKDASLKRLFDRYGFPKPKAGRFPFNIGAVEATEKLCAAGVPHIFIGEHSCEAKAPEKYRAFLPVRGGGIPERIPLCGHDEYTVAFSELERVARAWGYEVLRGPFADYLQIDWTEGLQCILSSRVEISGRAETLRQFVGDLYQYEYLLLQKRRG
ncbi:MAG: hypothetical protein A4E73_01400 [Syntrophaceae bacterium PtaU1.Bin231]|nr:MAG: hypothetical protein A4E73_01400 [Syntrophaceae bacterium PtaU1.Bin231]